MQPRLRSLTKRERHHSEMVLKEHQDDVDKRGQTKNACGECQSDRKSSPCDISITVRHRLFRQELKAFSSSRLLSLAFTLRSAHSPSAQNSLPDLSYTFVMAHRGEDGWSPFSDDSGVALHHCQGGADMWCEIRLFNGKTFNPRPQKNDVSPMKQATVQSQSPC